ncbi:pyridoxamine 5'-phosphate oxidase family protein [Mucilaginibacter sp.]|uniref:pyridoxamine 5'-phosphate oxidase family protein n=1 Tax=Mucilaginibacter sp. TaxID=1882438 RepID=UPI0025E41E5D|nr:pyridoxamine 5'-phosphate oxidase family protein [Mucilaginibacter sp.]
MATPAAHLIPSRSAKRANYEPETINAILDEALYCTISYSSENKPYSIPTAFVRYEDRIYIHGSVGSHLMRELEKGIPVCISVTLMDALVIAKSAFHHSVNYRSVVIFAQAEKVEDMASKIEAFKWLTNKIVPGSWDYLRPIQENEVRKTTALAFKIDEASAKIRTGMPVDDDEDLNLPIWTGLIPLQTKRMPPIPDKLSEGMPLPSHLVHI